MRRCSGVEARGVRVLGWRGGELRLIGRGLGGGVELGRDLEGRGMERERQENSTGEGWLLLFCAVFLGNISRGQAWRNFVETLSAKTGNKTKDRMERAQLHQYAFTLILLLA